MQKRSLATEPHLPKCIDPLANNKEMVLPILRDKAQDRIDAILQRYPTKRSAVLPLCHLAQEEYGYMSPEAVREVADILELDPTEVQGLVGFYTLLREKPTGEYVIEICNDLPCALRGADRFVEHVCRKLGIRTGETTADGLFSVETVMCVAACDRAPVAQINLEYFENLDPDKIDAIIEGLVKEAEATDAQEKPRADTAAGH
jgi:NADH-quinone oxidoreductase E subunit